MTEEAEISRVVPIVEGLRRAALDDENNQFSISVDTRRASVAEAALAAGAHLVNDVSGGTFDPGMLAAVAKARVPLVMMHMRWVEITGYKISCFDFLLIYDPMQCPSSLKTGHPHTFSRYNALLTPGNILYSTPREDEDALFSK